MKKFGVRLLAVLVVFGIGWTGLNYYGTRWDAESRVYAEQAIRSFAQQWSSEELSQRASKNFLEQTPSDKIQEFSKQYGDLLGPLKEIKGLRGEAGIHFFSGFELFMLTAQYLTRAKFEKGDADLFVQLIREKSQWKILSFRVIPVSPNTPNIRVLTMGPVYFAKGDTNLMLNYETLTPIDDLEALTKEADLIWPRFRIDVEKRNYSHAMLYASESVTHLFGLISKRRNYVFTYQRRPDGRWERMKPDKSWEPVD